MCSIDPGARERPKPPLYEPRINAHTTTKYLFLKQKRITLSNNLALGEKIAQTS